MKRRKIQTAKRRNARLGAVALIGVALAVGCVLSCAGGSRARDPVMQENSALKVEASGLRQDVVAKEAEVSGLKAELNLKDAEISGLKIELTEIKKAGGDINSNWVYAVLVAAILWPPGCVLIYMLANRNPRTRRFKARIKGRCDDDPAVRPKRTPPDVPPVPD